MATTYGTVSVIAGTGAGRTLKLQKLVSVIGSGKAADLQLSGEKVGENHASIEAGADGSCVLRNRSPFGTLVNKSRVDVHRLVDGDRIQIGAAALLEFHATGARAGAAPGQRKKMFIAIAVGFYLLAMGALVLKLQGMSGGAAGAFSESDLETALSETRAGFAAQLDPARAAPAAVPIDAADPTAAYYRVINARARGADAVEVGHELDAFIDGLRGHLREASALERQERWKAARAEYRDVLEMVPDVKLRVATLAAARLAATAEKLPDED